MGEKEEAWFPLGRLEIENVIFLVGKERNNEFWGHL